MLSFSLLSAFKCRIFRVFWRFSAELSRQNNSKDAPTGQSKPSFTVRQAKSTVCPDCRTCAKKLKNSALRHAGQNRAKTISYRGKQAIAAAFAKITLFYRRLHIFYFCGNIVNGSFQTNHP